MTATLVLIRTPSGYEIRRERPRLLARLAALWRERREAHWAALY